MIDSRNNTCTPMFRAKYKVSPNDMGGLAAYAQMAFLGTNFGSLRISTRTEPSNNRTISS